MKKVISIMTIVSAIITSILIICTFLTSYQFINIHLIFNSYEPMQIGLAITMFMLSIRFYLNEVGRKKVFYCLFSMLLTIGLVYLMRIVK